MFDDLTLVLHAGLAAAVALAARAGLGELFDRFLTVAGGAGHVPGARVSAVVAGMVAGADSIDDLALLRHGGMRQLFAGCYAPSTLVWCE